MKIKEKLALVYITINSITREYDGYLLSLLRKLKLYKKIKEFDPKAFIIAYEPKTIQGFWVKSV